MKGTRPGLPKTMILEATLHVFCFICAIHGARQGQGAYSGKGREVHLPSHVDTAKIKPPVISVVSKAHALIVNVQSDKDLWEEMGDNLQYRVFYKKEEEENFMIYKDLPYRHTDLYMEGLDAGVKYCVEVIYLIYNREIPSVKPSSPECTIVTESDDIKHTRVVVAIATAVFLVCILVPTCLWLVYQNQERLKKVLRPPLSVPSHILEFLLEDFDPPQPLGDAKHSASSAEEVWDTISVVTLKATDEMEDPKIHFVVGGSTPEGPESQTSIHQYE